MVIEAQEDSTEVTDTTEDTAEVDTGVIETTAESSSVTKAITDDSQTLEVCR